MPTGLSGRLTTGNPYLRLTYSSVDNPMCYLRCKKMPQMGTNVPKTVSRMILLSQKCYTLDIPLLPPSLNAWQSCHWAKRKRIKDEWCNAVWALCNEQRIPPMERIHLSAVLLFATKRKRDADNFESTLKKITQDVLVRIGTIPDDTPDHVSWGKIELGTDAKLPRTILVITPR